MARVTFHLPDGSSSALDVPPGVSLMEAARDHGLGGIVAECGGGSICGTCHVIVGASWFGKFEPAQATEMALVEFAPECQPTSRLSCQLLMREDLDGLEVRVPSEQIQS